MKERILRKVTKFGVGIALPLGIFTWERLVYCFLSLYLARCWAANRMPIPNRRKPSL